MLLDIIGLLFLYNVGHFLADYTQLSTKWMLDAKRFGQPLVPIMAHAGWHAFFVFVVSMSFRVGIVKSVALCIIQLLTHFLIDTVKGRLNAWYPALQSPANPLHWYVFGFDQFLHQVVLIITAGLAVSPWLQ